MLSLTCPQCAKKLTVKDELAGKKGRCPHCKAALVIPDLSQEDRTLAPAGQEVEASSPTLRAGDSQIQAKAPARPAADREAYDFLAPAQKPDEIGRLGPYRVLHVLGKGGMGVVFLAEETSLNRQVALKAMLPALAASESNRIRFAREAQAAANLEHDNIIPIFRVGEDRGVPFVAMPFLKGEPLDERLKREGKLPLADALRISREVASGLALAHDKNLVHRDIKPANIFLENLPKGATAPWRSRILDFGLARASTDAQMTQAGAIVGTPAYMAPEQTRGEKVDQRCDLFSLGCLLYRMITGENPFHGADTISTLVAVATVDPKPVVFFNPDVPQELINLIERLLEKDKSKRLQSAHEVLDILAEIDSTTPPAKKATAKSPPAKRRKDNDRTEVSQPPKRESKKAGRVPLALMAGGAAAAVLLIAVLVYAITRGTPEKSPPGIIAEIKKDEAIADPNKKDKENVPGANANPPLKLDPNADAERQIGDWILSLNGSFHIKRAGANQESHVTGIGKHWPPKEPVAIVGFKIQDPPKRLTEANLATLRGLKQAMKWDLTNAIEPSALKALDGMPKLDSLVLANNGLTSKDLTILPKAVSFLDLTKNPIDDDFFQLLSRSSELFELRLGGTRVTGKGIASLIKYKRLQFLVLDNLPVDDATVESLVQFPSIRNLSLRNTAITDKGLQRLALCELLTTLDVTSTRVTKAGVQRLHELRAARSISVRGPDPQP